MTALLAGFGLAWDYTGESVLTLSSNNWGLIGLIAFVAFVVITIIREVDLAFQQRPQIEINSNSLVGMELTLVVHNKSQVPASFSAVMTCTFDYGDNMSNVQIVGLQNVSMCWESSGKANEPINGDGYKILKLCSKEENKFLGSGSIVHYMKFYKVESDSLQAVSCAHWSEGDRIPKVNIDIQVDSSMSIKGRTSWKYQVYYVAGNNMIGITNLPSTPDKEGSQP